MKSSKRLSPACGFGSNAPLAGFLTVVVDDFDIFRSSGGPDETESSVIVDPDALLTGPVRFQRFQTITGRYAKIAQIERSVEETQLAQRYLLHIRR